MVFNLPVTTEELELKADTRDLSFQPNGPIRVKNPYFNCFAEEEFESLGKLLSNFKEITFLIFEANDLAKIEGENIPHLVQAIFQLPKFKTINIQTTDCSIPEYAKIAHPILECIRKFRKQFQIEPTELSIKEINLFASIKAQRHLLSDRSFIRRLLASFVYQHLE
jgi:hypothetical protein